MCLGFQPVVGPDGKKKEPESNVLLASIENMQYVVTVDVLHTVRMWGFFWHLSLLLSIPLSLMCLFVLSRCSRPLALYRRLPYSRRMAARRL